MGRYENDLRAKLLCQPERVARGYAEPLGFVVLSQYDAVPRLRVSGHGHRFSPQSGLVQAFHGGVKVVHIRVKDHPFHSAFPLLFVMRL